MEQKPADDALKRFEQRQKQRGDLVNPVVYKETHLGRAIENIFPRGVVVFWKELQRILSI